MRGAVRLVLCSALPPACRDRQWRPRRPNQHLPTHSFDKLPVSQENPKGRRARARSSSVTLTPPLTTSPSHDLTHPHPNQRTNQCPKPNPPIRRTSPLPSTASCAPSRLSRTATTSACASSSSACPRTS